MAVANPWPCSLVHNPIRSTYMLRGRLGTSPQEVRIEGREGQMEGITDVEFVSQEMGLNVAIVSSALLAKPWTFWLHM